MTIRSLDGLRIVVIGINYWPEPTGNAPYTKGIAEHLAGQGAKVDVLTSMPYYPQWSVPVEYGKKLRSKETHNGVTIHRFRTYVPARQSAIKRSIFEAGFYFNTAVKLGIEKPHLIIGFDPSLGGPLLSATFARRWNVPYGIIVQDLVSGAVSQTGISGGDKLAGITGKLEGWSLGRAAAVAVVAEGFRPRLESLGVRSDRIHRIRNWTHIQPSTLDKSAARAQLDLPQNAFIALHAGNMGLKQGLENVVAAAKLAAEQPDPIQFVFVGDGNQRQMLQELAAGLPNVRFIPPLPDADFPNALAAADVLLVNQRPTITDMCLPSKLTSYLAANRPVIAAVAPESETARELEAAQAGMVVPFGEPRQLVAALDALRAAPEVGHAFAERGAIFANEQLSAAASFAAIDRFVGAVSANHATATIPVESLQPEGSA